VNQMLQCPKCRGTMRTYNRSGVHIEQCDSCRGIFLDYGELESLTQLEGRFAGPAAPPPPTPGPAMHGQPAWGHGHGHHGHYRQRSLGKMLFSS
jgi:uncharacterized protein